MSRNVISYAGSYPLDKKTPYCLTIRNSLTSSPKSGLSKMVIARHCLDIFIIVTALTSLTTFTSLTVSSEVLVVQSAVQSECKDKNGTIENFYFAGKKMKKDCDWVKNQRRVLRKKICITKDVVKNHCIKLCNNYGEASLPIDPPPYQHF